MILSVDPGLQHCGVALWSSEGKLIAAWLARGNGKTRGANEARARGMRWRSIVRAVGEAKLEWLVIEVPQVYKMSPGDPNDLIDIAGVAGGLVCMFDAPTHTYLPHQWKGDAPKKAIQAWCKKTLSRGEWSRIEAKPKGLAHNVYDAVGIGLKFLGRLDSKIEA